jgi:hypothetical protein
MSEYFPGKSKSWHSFFGLENGTSFDDSVLLRIRTEILVRRLRLWRLMCGGGYAPP